MIGPDQDPSDFPRWIWPYIRVEDLAKSRVLASQDTTQVTATPQAALLGHFTAIVQAVQLKSMATRIEGPVGVQLGKASSQAILDEIDDWCGTKPHPFPHRAGELATHLAVLAASSSSDQLRTELLSVVQQISGRISGAR